VIGYGPHEIGRYTQHGQPIVELQRPSKSKRLKKPALPDTKKDYELSKRAVPQVAYAADRRSSENLRVQHRASCLMRHLAHASVSYGNGSGRRVGVRPDSLIPVPDKVLLAG
jgi:hypothetical protein